MAGWGVLFCRSFGTRETIESSKGMRVLLVMFGPLLDSMFHFGPMFLGSFVIIRLVLTLNFHLV